MWAHMDPSRTEGCVDLLALMESTWLLNMNNPRNSQEFQIDSLSPGLSWKQPASCLSIPLFPCLLFRRDSLSLSSFVL